MHEFGINKMDEVAMDSRGQRKNQIIQGPQKTLVSGLIFASVLAGVALLLGPLIFEMRKQKQLLRRPKGRVVPSPIQLDVDQTPAYD